MWSSIRSTSSTYATILTFRRYTAASVGRPRRPALRTSLFVPPDSWHSQCPGRLQRVAAFHSTPRRSGLPAFGPVLLAIFKVSRLLNPPNPQFRTKKPVYQSSAALEIARTAGRIALTFVPVILIKNRKSLYWLKKAEIHGIPTTEEKKAQLLKYVRKRTVLLHLLFFVPVFTFWLTIVASLERTPLTGRCVL